MIISGRLPRRGASCHQNGKILAAKGLRSGRLETKTPCATNTNFRLASVTKQFTHGGDDPRRAKKTFARRATHGLFPEFPNTANSSAFANC